MKLYKVFAIKQALCEEEYHVEASGKEQAEEKLMELFAGRGQGGVTFFTRRYEDGKAPLIMTDRTVEAPLKEEEKQDVG